MSMNQRLDTSTTDPSFQLHQFVTDSSAVATLGQLSVDVGDEYSCCIPVKIKQAGQDLAALQWYCNTNT